MTKAWAAHQPGKEDAGEFQKLQKEMEDKMVPAQSGGGMVNLRCQW